MPFIDEHAKAINAPPERVWSALLSTMGAQPGHGLPRRLVAVWGLAPAGRRGDWAGAVAVGDAIPGFEVAEASPPRRLTLRGRHRFSRYELHFELAPDEANCVELHAATSASFPGALGRIYRGLVINSGGHNVALRRMLAAIARRAERPV